VLNIDIGHSVTYPFEDRNWSTKLIVFLILGFIPGLNLIMWVGYAMSIARNMARGEQFPLPAWDSWSDIAVRGLLAITATGLYFGPAIVLTGCLLLASWVLGERGAGLFWSVRCIGLGLAAVYGLLVGYVMGSGHLRFILADQFYHYLDVGGRFRDLRSQPGLFGTLFMYLAALTFLVLLLALVAAGLFLFVLSMIATTGGLVSLILVILLALALLGFLAIVTMAFLAGGYILGAAGLAVSKR
jgi:hypothetical protein